MSFRIFFAVLIASSTTISASADTISLSAHILIVFPNAIRLFLMVNSRIHAFSPEVFGSSPKFFNNSYISYERENNLKYSKFVSPTIAEDEHQRILVMLMDKHLNIKHIPPKSPKNKYILLCCMFLLFF